MYELLTPELALPSTELHVVFSAECIPAFDWQSVGLFYSFYRCRQPGKITRLLACSDEQLAAYPKTNMDIGPTFVHKNMRFDAVNDVERGDPFHDDKAGHGYASYNKPYSVMAWLEAVTVEEDYVLMMDTDMLLRAPLDPVAYGVERGTVVSAKYSYLYGTESGFARHFIDESLHERLVGVGGFHIFHRDDLRQIAPLWLEYTKKVRAFANTHPDEYFNESFRLPSPPQAGSAGPSDEEVAVQHKQARWHGEMYGYVFAAALVGVTHHVRQDVMMYPGNVSGSRSLGLRRTALGPMARHCRLLLPARFPSSPARRSSCTTAATTPSGRPTSTRVRRSGAGNPGLQRIHAPLPLLLTRSAPTPGQ
jgi:hypothetical protein